MDITQEELSIISDLAKKQQRLQQAVFEAEARVKELKEQLEQVKTFDLPNALAECGCSFFKLDTGQSIEVKPHYYGSIKDENREAAFLWLRNNNLDAVIKNVVKCEFGKGEDEDARKAVEQLVMMGFPVLQIASIHPMTLKALIKDLMERGVNFPMELFGAGVKNEAKIVDPK